MITSKMTVKFLENLLDQAEGRIKELEEELVPQVANPELVILAHTLNRERGLDCVIMTDIYHNDFLRVPSRRRTLDVYANRYRYREMTFSIREEFSESWGFGKRVIATVESRDIIDAADKVADILYPNRNR